MFIVGMLSWWYGPGMVARSQLVLERLKSTVDYFSIDLLLKTLFSPFRQISAGKVDGSLGVIFRAWVDRTISRIIGFFVRIVIIFIGIFSVSFHGLLGILTLVCWMVIPLLPFIGFIVWLSGWVPKI